MNKTMTIAFRVTPDEHKEISKKAKKMKMGVSDYCRKAVMERYSLTFSEEIVTMLMERMNSNEQAEKPTGNKKGLSKK